MKGLKKIKLIQLMSIFALVAIMVTTTAVSFAYWKSGIEGAKDTKVLNVVIGEGNAVSAQLNLTEHSSTNGTLIPRTRPTSGADVHEMVFKIDVAWVPSQSGLASGYTGTLEVKNTSIMIDSTEMINALTNGGEKLFVVNIDFGTSEMLPSNTSGTTNTKRVTITVQLNEPIDSVQYYKIAGKTAIFTFLFEIESRSETAA